MKEVIKTLKARNLILKNFYKKNREQISKMKVSRDFDIRKFYFQKESLYQQLNFTNQNLRESMKELEDLSASHLMIFKKDILRELMVKDHLSKAILDQDLEILSILDSMKSNIIRKLSTADIAG